ncbi:MAG TPA: hypothetical protein VKX46_10495, partial [Ktedonobacteraceae bacterium]|nr:hypothetical protein [Ktedonobacteraceae bacterium]
SARWPRLINSELHNFLTLLALIFTAIHVLAVWIDPFTNFGWSEVFIPFASHYRPLWMALGLITLYLGLAIGLSTWVRPLIGYTWWRRLHVLTLLMYGLVTLHGIGTGSDTQTWWGLSIYIIGVLLIGALLCQRLLVPVNPRGRSHPVLATLVVLFILAGAMWTVIEPLQSGWGARAGTVTTNSSQNTAPPQPSPASDDSNPSQ